MTFDPFGLRARAEADTLRSRIAHLEAELERVREDARSEIGYARDLVRSAMLKSGMWPAEATRPREQPAPLPTAFRAPVPLAQAAAEARRREDEMLERARTRAAVDKENGAPARG